MSAALSWIRDKFSATGNQWPPEDLREVWEEIEKFSAFRRSDDGVLRLLEQIPWYGRYLISPVPRMISRASANLLLGEPPEWSPGDEADADRLEYLLTENELDTEGHRAAVIASSEGEVWGRICVRPDLLDVPIIEFVSRRGVIPHFAGRFVTGATFFKEWEISATEVVRLFEHYEPGVIRSELYRGGNTFIGQPIPLDSFEKTAGTEPVVFTGFDSPLCCFIPNSIDTDPCRGFSDYAGLEDRFLSINRAATIGDVNTELAGKKRALLDVNYVDGPEGGRALTSDEVWIRDEQTGDQDVTKPLQIMEFNYDATQIALWLDHLIDSTLSFGGASPQLVGRSLDGAALSGTALKLKMVHSLLEASGKGRYLDRGLRRLVRMAAVFDSRPIFEGGFGRSWTDADTPPTINRQDGLPRDDLEAAQYVTTLVGGDAISVDARVRYLHPDWTEDQIEEEIDAIEAEKEAAKPDFGFGPGVQPPENDLPPEGGDE